jgi:hypothetical protein
MKQFKNMISSILGLVILAGCGGEQAPVKEKKGAPSSVKTQKESNRLDRQREAAQKDFDRYTQVYNDAHNEISAFARQLKNSPAAEQDTLLRRHVLAQAKSRLGSFGSRMWNHTWAEFPFVAYYDHLKDIASQLKRYKKKLTTKSFVVLLSEKSQSKAQDLSNRMDLLITDINFLLKLLDLSGQV